MLPANKIDLLAKVALTFIDGDDLENILIDQEKHTDYRFDEFNRLKQVLTKVERFDDETDVSAILWRLYPGNSYVAEPMVAGTGLPNTGWRRVIARPELQKAVLEDCHAMYDWGERGISHYFPVHNSNDDIVGALELLLGRGYKQDVGTTEMFVEKLEIEEDDE